MSDAGLRFTLRDLLLWTLLCAYLCGLLAIASKDNLAEYWLRGIAQTIGSVAMSFFFIGLAGVPFTCVALLATAGFWFKGPKLLLIVFLIVNLSSFLVLWIGSDQAWYIAQTFCLGAIPILIAWFVQLWVNRTPGTRQLGFLVFASVGVNVLLMLFLVAVRVVQDA